MRPGLPLGVPQRQAWHAASHACSLAEASLPSPSPSPPLPLARVPCRPAAALEASRALERRSAELAEERGALAAALGEARERADKLEDELTHLTGQQNLNQVRGLGWALPGACVLDGSWLGLCPVQERGGAAGSRRSTARGSRQRLHPHRRPPARLLPRPLRGTAAHPVSQEDQGREQHAAGGAGAPAHRGAPHAGALQRRVVPL